MKDYPEPVSRLIAELKELPGIGAKSAQRIAFHILRASANEDAHHLARAIIERQGKDRHLLRLQQRDR